MQQHISAWWNGGGKGIVLGGVLGALLALVLLGAAAFAVLATAGGTAWVRTTLGIAPMLPTPTEDSSGIQSGVVGVVDFVEGAVVSIVATKDVPIVQNCYQEFPFGGGINFRVPGECQIGRRSQEIGSGSGFFISADGELVTNAHVVQDEEATYTVFRSDGTSFTATVIAKDTVFDIALLDVDIADAAFLTFADSATVKVGQTVVAIGNALGTFRNTVSGGIVSGLARSIFAATPTGDAEQLFDLIQTDAAINPGNSGGPLLDLAGKVVGVNVAASGAENIGFAIPANIVSRAVEDLRTHGRVVRPFLGVRWLPVTPQVAQKNGLAETYGALIRSTVADELPVVPGSPAERAGLEEGDVILAVDGKPVTQETPLPSLLFSHRVDDAITLTVLHGADRREVTVTLAEAPSDQVR